MALRGILLYGSDVKGTDEKFSVGFWPQINLRGAVNLTDWLDIFNYLSCAIHTFLNDQLMKRCSAICYNITGQVSSECRGPKTDRKFF